MQELPEQAGIQLANWYWKGVRQFVWERFGTSLSRSSCLNWLHRLGFAFKRPKKRLLKADQAKRKSFVEEYAALWEEAQRTEARIFFAQAHFRADAELRGKWVLKGEPALVESTAVWREGQLYSAVCLETGGWSGWNWRATVRDLGGLLGPVEEGARWTAECDLGQRGRIVGRRCQYLRTPEL